MHAYYAVYFPELSPLDYVAQERDSALTQEGDRAAIAASAIYQWTPTESSQYMVPLFAAGIIVTLLAKETRGEELPD